MNTNELIVHIAAETNMPKAAVQNILSLLVTEISGAALKGEDVDLRGLGKFKVTARAARQGRNPSTGETIEIAASRKLAFVATKALKDALNGR